MPSQITVSIGDHNIRKTSEAPSQVVHVLRIHQHENYVNDDVTEGSDISLLELVHEVAYDDHVQPACVPHQNVAAGTMCIASGWGTLVGKILVYTNLTVYIY